MYMGRQALCKSIRADQQFANVYGQTSPLQRCGQTSPMEMNMCIQTLCICKWAHKLFANLYGQTSPLQIYMGTQAICKCSNILRAHFMKTHRATTKGTLERTPKRTSKRTSGENSRENTHSTGGVHPSHTLRCAIAIFELRELH